MSLRVGALAVSAAIAFLWIRPVKAQMALAVDGSGTLGIDEHRLGEAVDARLGFRFGLWRAFHFHAVIFQPEIVAGYMHLPSLGEPRNDEQEGRAGAGMRLGCLCGAVEGFAYGHVNGAAGTRALVPLYDLGTALDWRFSGSSLGIHASYDFFGSGRLGWYEIGPHFEYRWFAW